jgi:hypothetical protein
MDKQGSGVLNKQLNDVALQRQNKFILRFVCMLGCICYSEYMILGAALYFLEIVLGRYDQ